MKPTTSTNEVVLDWCFGEVLRGKRTGLDVVLHGAG